MTVRIFLTLALSSTLSACGDPSAFADAGALSDDASAPPGSDAGCDGCVARFSADTVVEAPGDSGEGFGDASRATNGVRGAGETMGSLDVFSLGYEEGVDDVLVLRWAGARVENVPGPDLVVFENAFVFAGGPARFMDPAVVEVSRDGVAWVAFPHDFLAPDETRYSADPASWVGFAGLTPVHLHEEDNPVDPFDTALAGGDAFDLDDLPAGGEAAATIRRDGFIYLRIVAAALRVNPDTGELFARDPASNGPDIDGVYARSVVPENP